MEQIKHPFLRWNWLRKFYKELLSRWLLLLPFCSVILLAACQVEGSGTVTPEISNGSEAVTSLVIDDFPTAVSEGELLDFTTIARVKWEYPGGYFGQEPALFIIRGVEDVLLLDKWIDNKAKLQLNNLNFEETFALVAFQGLQVSSGYSVQIQQIIFQDDTVYVYAHFEEPGSGMAVTDGATSPFHIVQATKPEGWPAVATFRLIVAGETVVQSVLPRK